MSVSILPGTTLSYVNRASAAQLDAEYLVYFVRITRFWRAPIHSSPTQNALCQGQPSEANNKDDFSNEGIEGEKGLAPLTGERHCTIMQTPVAQLCPVLWN